MKSKQILLNIIANAFAMLVSTGINFFLTPYITRTVGVEAYGFVPMASYFVSYVTIVTTAFNSMGSRFITVSLQKNDKNQANEYFSTIFFMNLGLAVICTTVFTFIVAFLTKLIHIPQDITTDVRIMFALTFLSAVVSLAFNAFASATFCKNRLDLQSVIKIAGAVVRAVLIIVLFGLFPAKVFYIGVAAISMNIVESLLNVVVYKKIMTELAVRRADFKTEHIRTLFMSGVWNSVAQLSNILMTGLDLLIANIFISPTDSGILSVAKIMPSLLYTAIALIISAFGPQFVIDYAKSDKADSMLGTMDFSAKLMSFCSAVLVAGFIGLGKEFFTLWVPEQNANLLLLLAVLTLIADAASYPIKAFDNIFTAADKLRWPAVSTLVCGLLNVALMIPLLKFTNLGLYAVAGTSVVLIVIKDLCFKIPYIAKIVKVGIWYFWKYILKYALSVGLIIAVSLITKRLIPISNWALLGIDAVIIGSVGCILNSFIFLNKNERKAVKKKLLKISQ
ncbi:MAG: oligosaccharide flippase family protein [Acutalibacteraceae bacterium]|nr:oligosaccharide flippase family protein [Acutalibacteraceae bacterium]